MMAAEVEVEFLPTDLAREALAASDGIVGKAVVWAMDWLRAHPEFAASHAEEMARAWLLGHITSTRRRDGNPANAVGKAAEANVLAHPAFNMRAAVERNYSRMMDAPLYGGKRIGDATPDEIRESARMFRENGITMLRKAVWQDSVAAEAEKNGCGCNERVSSALSPRRVEELWEVANADRG